jgi:hypothetical protein
VSGAKLAQLPESIARSSLSTANFPSARARASASFCGCHRFVFRGISLQINRHAPYTSSHGSLPVSASFLIERLGSLSFLATRSWAAAASFKQF